MKISDRAGFKKSLLSFDKILNAHSRRAVEAALHDLNTSCLSCHSMWKDKAQ